MGIDPAKLDAAIDRVQWVIAHCEAQQQLQGGPHALITLKILDVPKNQHFVRAFGRRSPLGQVLADGERFAVVGWKADDLLAFLRPYLAELEAKRPVTLLADAEVPNVPADVAVCPICGAEIVIEELDEFEMLGDGSWTVRVAKVNCTTEPEIDSPEWKAWFAGHWSMPYVDWLPVEMRVRAWLRHNFRWRMDYQEDPQQPTQVL